VSLPVLSVVIPTLNEQGTIAACLASIGHENEVEVVVSDGGSSDQTRELVRESGRAVVVEGPPGRGSQLRRGVDVAASSRLLLLHADCRLPADWLGPVQEALDDPTTALACFRLITEPVADGAGPLQRAWLRLLDLRSHAPVLPYGDQGYAIRRDVYDRIGGVPDIPLMEDVVMARTCRRTGRIRRIPLPIRTSARRFASRPVRSRLITATFPMLFRAGFPPEVLARWYGESR
jgi:rSAM/selenodomain-associated transferase 2